MKPAASSNSREKERDSEKGEAEKERDARRERERHTEGKKEAVRAKEIDICTFLEKRKMTNGGKNVKEMHR